MQVGSSAFGFTNFFQGSMRHNDYYFYNFLYKSHMGTHLAHHQTDTSDSDTCISVGFNLL
jgi:hypothetical protein